MPHSESNLGRYRWTRVRTNRHKVNKRRDVSDAHLVGRRALLELDHKEVGTSFPLISDAIVEEIAMIDDEIALRAAGKSKPTKLVAEAPHEWEDFESLASLEHTTMPEGDPCES